MNTKKLAYGKEERHFPVKRYVAWSATAVAVIALPFLLRTCGPKVEPIQEPIMLIAPHACGKCAPDTTRFKGQNGAPDTIIIGASSQKEQGCDSLKPAFNSDCGCKKVEKKPKKAVEAAPVTTQCRTCAEAIFKADSRGGRIKASFQGRIASVANQLKENYGGGSRVDVTVTLGIAGDGFITAQEFTVTGNGGSTKVDLSSTIGMNAVGRQVDSPGLGTCCTVDITVPAP
jgi:hypothetical protein